MNSQLNNLTNHANTQILVQNKLSAAWTSFMFLYIYVDYLVLHKPGHIEGILAGMIWEFPISQTFMVIALTSVSIPALMIVLSTALPPHINRITNLILATLYIPYSLFNIVGESWTLFFGLGIGLELLLLGFILRSAWTWQVTEAREGTSAINAQSMAR